MASTLELLRRLTNEKIEFVVVGGVAAIAHGSATVTEDLDVCIRFDLETVRAVFRAVGDLHPRQRMHPDRPPLGESPERYVGYKNLYLSTDEGVLDLLGSVMAIGEFAATNANAVTMPIAGLQIRVLSLDDLMTSKRALGRPKDKQVVAELERVRELTRSKAP